MFSSGIIMGRTRVPTVVQSIFLERFIFLFTNVRWLPQVTKVADGWNSSHLTYVIQDSCHCHLMLCRNRIVMSCPSAFPFPSILEKCHNSDYMCELSKYTSRDPTVKKAPTPPTPQFWFCFRAKLARPKLCQNQPRLPQNIKLFKQRPCPQKGVYPTYPAILVLF